MKQCPILENTWSRLWLSRDQVGIHAYQIHLDAKALTLILGYALNEDGSRIWTKVYDMAHIRSAILNILRVNSIQNVSQSLYVNAFDQLLALCSSKLEQNACPVQASGGAPSHARCSRSLIGCRSIGRGFQ